MIEIDGLAEVVLNVHDVDRAVAFYGSLLGLERLTPKEQGGPIFFRAGSATSRVPALLVLVPLPEGAAGFDQPRTLHHLAFTIPEEAFQPARAALLDAGLEVRGGKHPVLSVRTMYVTDPEGNEVELISPVPAG
jgi:catechol-2,3-dioxygenase